MGFFRLPPPVAPHGRPAERGDRAVPRARGPDRGILLPAGCPARRREEPCAGLPARDGLAPDRRRSRGPEPLPAGPHLSRPRLLDLLRRQRLDVIDLDRADHAVPRGRLGARRRRHRRRRPAPLRGLLGPLQGRRTPLGGGAHGRDDARWRGDHHGRSHRSPPLPPPGGGGPRLPRQLPDDRATRSRLVELRPVSRPGGAHPAPGHTRGRSGRDHATFRPDPDPSRRPLGEGRARAQCPVVVGTRGALHRRRAGTRGPVRTALPRRRFSEATSTSGER